MSEKKKFDRKQNKYRSHKPFTPPKKFNFTPRSAGHMQCAPGYTWDLPVNHITIHYVYSGKGTFELDGKVYHLKHGDAFIVNYNDKIRFTADMDDPWHYFWLSFYSPLFGEMLRTLDSPILKNISESIFVEPTTRSECGKLTTEFLISKLYLLHDEIFAPDMTQTSSSLAIEAAVYINNNHGSNLTVENLADHFGVTRNHLSREFKKKHGLSVKQYIIRVRLSEGKGLLENGLSVKEAAYLCGYSDPLAFSKMYKKTYGIAPKSVFDSLE